jgi:hypothetical protein
LIGAFVVTSSAADWELAAVIFLLGIVGVVGIGLYMKGKTTGPTTPITRLLTRVSCRIKVISAAVLLECFALGLAVGISDQAVVVWTGAGLIVGLTGALVYWLMWILDRVSMERDGYAL